jgi:hypothetical protein
MAVHSDLTLEARRIGIPEHMIGTLVRYVDHGIRPGSFLTAVLSNDLMEALGRADDENRHSLHRYGQFLYSVAPSGCFRSPEAVSAWIERGGLRGAEGRS